MNSIGKKNIFKTLFLFGVLAGGLIYFENTYLTVITFTLLFVIYYYIIELNTSKTLKKQSEIEEVSFNQLSILFSLYNKLGINKEMPLSRKWALSPDILNAITNEILDNKPEAIVEASSGISTIVIGYALKKNGKGKLYSLEDNLKYYELNKQQVEIHGLEDFVEVIYAPIVEHIRGNERFLWYDIEEINDLKSIEVLVVDGPPNDSRVQARYPAVPILYDQFSDDVTIFVDDGVRVEIKDTIGLWQNNYHFEYVHYFNYEFGMYVLKNKQKDKAGRTLLVFTTANQIYYNIKGIKSVLANKPDYCDLLVVDDASNDGTVEWCLENNVDIITKEEPLGVTHSWNVGYKKFKQENYDNVFFLNSDIIVPENAIQNMVNQLKSYHVIAPLTTLKGAGHQPLQDVKKYHEIDIDEYNPENVQNIQMKIENSNQFPIELEYVNGFFFGVNKNVVECEYSNDTLFNTDQINVGSENSFCERVNQVYNNKIAVDLCSFVFHYKGVSLKVTNLDDQEYQYNIYRNLTWKQADSLRSSRFRKLMFVLSYKMKKK